MRLVRRGLLDPQDLLVRLEQREKLVTRVPADLSVPLEVKEHLVLLVLKVQWVIPEQREKLVHKERSVQQVHLELTELTALLVQLALRGSLVNKEVRAQLEQQEQLVPQV